MSKTVYALAIGVLNIQTGKTQYDWSIYDGPEQYPAKDYSKLFYCQGGFLLYGSKESALEEGDKVIIRHNDTQRKLQETTIKKVLPCEKEPLIEGLLELGYDYRQLRAFAKKKFKAKLRTSYSIKGITAD